MTFYLDLPFRLTFGNEIIAGISPFTFAFLLAFVFGYTEFVREMRLRGQDEKHIQPLLIIIFLSAIAGAKIGFVLENRNAISFYDAFFSISGLVFYGGVILSSSTVYIYILLRRASLDILECLISPLTLGYSIGRLGCMLSGDGCYGYEGSIYILGITYGPGSVLPTAGVHVWNTPLIESIFSFLMFLYFHRLTTKGVITKTGYKISLFLILNGSLRFIIEFFRINEPILTILQPPELSSYQEAILSGNAASFLKNYYWFGFSASQTIGFMMLLSGIYLYIKLLKSTK